jgi:hypothetical protein
MANRGSSWTQNSSLGSLPPELETGNVAGSWTQNSSLGSLRPELDTGNVAAKPKEPMMPQ